MSTTIPAGYRLSVSSWENDVDNRQTQILEGLTKEQTQFYVEFSKWFDSKNHPKHKSKTFGNMYDPSLSEIEEAYNYIKETLIQYSKIVDELWGWEVIDECIADGEFGDVINDLHTKICGSSAEEFMFRVVESFKVEYISEPIVLEDVTHEFKGE